MEKQVGSQPVVATCWSFVLGSGGFFCVSVHTQTFNVKTRLRPCTHKHTHRHTHLACTSPPTCSRTTQETVGGFRASMGSSPKGLFFNPTSLNKATLMRLTNLQALWSTAIPPSHAEEKLITAPGWKMKRLPGCFFL